MNGLLDTPKGKRKLPEWKKSEMELQAMEKKIGFEADRTPEPDVIWKFNDQSLTDVDREIIAKKNAEAQKAKEAELERIVERTEEKVREAERKVRDGEIRLSEAYRRTGVIPF